jgi:MoxR-like ATPase
MVEEGNTDTAPYGLGTYGSRSTPVSGAATAMACRKIKAKAQMIAAYMLEVHDDDLEWDVDRFQVKGNPERFKTMTELAWAAYHEVPPGMEPGLEAINYYDIRLQCYEGLDQNAALYEWNYQRQLLAIKTREGIGENANAIEEHIFSEKYLLERPLLAAIRREKPPVLLIDEVDRADEEFEAFLLELLSDFQVSIPELGTIRATSIPRVVLTSNGTRELSDALRRRCLYHYVDFPDVDREAKIIGTRTPGIDTTLALQIARMVAAVRKEDLRKVPGVAETLDWAATLAGLEVHDLRQEPEAVYETMICLLKTHEDRARVTREVSERLLGKVA